jgi:GTP-binding protein
VLATLDKAAVSYQVVLTKADQVKQGQLETVMAAVEARLRQHPAAFPQVLVTSSRTGAGMAELRAAMALLLRERSS